MDVKRGIDKATKIVIENLKNLSKKVSSKEEIAQVATFLLMVIRKLERKLQKLCKK